MKLSKSLFVAVFIVFVTGFDRAAFSGSTEISKNSEKSATDQQKSNISAGDEKKLEKRIKSFSRLCSKGSKEATLILLDTTDTLRPEQIQFVIDNYTKDIKWQNKGDRFTVVRLDAKPAAIMDFHTICAPKHVDKINTFLDPIRKIKVRNKHFKWTLKELVIKFGKQKKKSTHTFLVEAITAFYRNKRYGFLKIENRKLIIISDLYQHSPLISFFDMCSRPPGKERLRCPNIDESLKKNKRFANYLEGAKPNFRPTDSIEIYYLNVNDRVDRSAERWWRGYFIKAGLNENSLKIIPELQ